MAADLFAGAELYARATDPEINRLRLEAATQCGRLREQRGGAMSRSNWRRRGRPMGFRKRWRGRQAREWKRRDAEHEHEIEREREREPAAELKYAGLRHSGIAVVMRPDDMELEVGPSLALRAYSPDGFDWGCEGGGPSQLALALILDHTGDADLALRWHQDFRAAFVLGWGVGWVLPVAVLDRWLTERMGPGEGG